MGRYHWQNLDSSEWRQPDNGLVRAGISLWSRSVALVRGRFALRIALIAPPFIAVKNGAPIPCALFTINAKAPRLARFVMKSSQYD
jgi:hypothetical protein